MKFSRALKQNRDFKRLYARGKSAVSPYMALYCGKNHLGVNRVGITVSSKIGNAVVRNRVRRRFKEIYRLHEEKLQIGYDIILVSRVRSARSPYRALESSFLTLAKKLDLIRQS